MALTAVFPPLNYVSEKQYWAKITINSRASTTKQKTKKKKNLAHTHEILRSPSLANPLSAGAEVLQKTTEVPLPFPSAEQQRHFRAITGPTSIWAKYTQKWLAQILKHVALADEPNRFHLIETAHKVMRWRWTTTAVYWAATMCARKILGLPKIPADAKATNFLEHQARTECHAYAKFLTDTVFLQIWMQTEDRFIAVIVCIAYICGQRVSDVAQLASEDITIEQFQLLATQTICITVRRGKVIPYIGAYVLHLSITCPVALALLVLSRQRRGFLFTNNNSAEERSKLGARICAELKMIDTDLEQRSIRRGGLERMARQGVPLQKIQECFSKHRTIPMLLGYLRHGAVSLHTAQTQLEVTAWTAACMQNQF